MNLNGSKLDLEKEIVGRLEEVITKEIIDQMSCKKRLDFLFLAL